MQFRGPILERTSRTLAMLSAQAVEKAKSGHPGAAMGMSHGYAYVLLNLAVFDPADPKFAGRTRINWSNGHASALPYSGAVLYGSLPLEELKQFRQLHSKTPGHPERGCCHGIEGTSGPLGQGIANAIGQAVGEKMLAARFNRDGYPLFGNTVFCLMGDGCFQEGPFYEAARMAGQWGLDNLLAFYDFNSITIDGSTDSTLREVNVNLLFESLGWRVISMDGQDFQSIEAGFAEALNRTGKPTVIIAKTTIGFGAPTKAGKSACHGSPLGKTELDAVAANWGWPADESFHIPDDVAAAFQQLRTGRLSTAVSDWKDLFSRWRNEFPDLAAEYDKLFDRSLDDNLVTTLSAQLQTNGKPISTRKLSQMVLIGLSKVLSYLVGGSADLACSCLADVPDWSVFDRENHGGRKIQFGISEHGMAAVSVGIAQHEAFAPFIGTFLGFTNYAIPAIRLAAISKLSLIVVGSHDSFLQGEDGGTHQPIEHLSAFRLMPGVRVCRPATAMEVVYAWLSALKYQGPTILALTRQDIPTYTWEALHWDKVKRGAYAIAGMDEETGDPDYTLVATGSGPDQL